MATSSKGIEILWQRYSEEVSKKGFSTRRMEYLIMYLRNGTSTNISSLAGRRDYENMSLELLCVK